MLMTRTANAWQNVTSGTIQGICQGPTLFLKCINSVKESI